MTLQLNDIKHIKLEFRLVEWTKSKSTRKISLNASKK